MKAYNPLYLRDLEKDVARAWRNVQAAKAASEAKPGDYRLRAALVKAWDAFEKWDDCLRAQANVGHDGQWMPDTEGNSDE